MDGGVRVRVSVVYDGVRVRVSVVEVIIVFVTQSYLSTRHQRL